MEWRKYLLYHGRWQFSTVVMAVPITLFSHHFSPPIALAFAQVIGACLFWYIDRWIFDDQPDSV